MVKNQESLGILRNSKATLMDLSSIDQSGQTVIRELQKQMEQQSKHMAEMSAMVKGKGGGSWSSYQPGKGPGAGTSGPPAMKGAKGSSKGALAIAHRRAREQGKGAQVVCPTEQRKGFCDFAQRNPGKVCRFAHYKNIPAQLSNVEGLISTDFMGIPVTMDENGDYICGTCTPEKAAALSSVSDEVAKMAATIAEEYDFQVYEVPGKAQQAAPGGESASGFPRH